MKNPAAPVRSDSPFAGAWLLFYAVAATLLLRGYLYGLVNPVEVPSLEALVGPACFPRDFIVQESLKFSPRFYYFRLLAGLAPSLAALPWVVFASFAVAVGGLLTGLAALARAFGGGRDSQLLLAWWGVTSVAGCVGGVFLYTHGPVPAVFAAPFAVWGLAHAVRRDWLAAYACFGAAALLQFLVGFLPGLLVLPALLAHGRSLPRVRTAAGLGLWAAALGAVYVPMLLAGTSAGKLTTPEFIEIYAYLRHPHHVVPSTWGELIWLQWAVFQIGVGVWLRESWAELAAGARTVLASVLAGSAVLLLVAYLGVEIWPTRLVATLQLARTTPFAGLLGCAVLALAAPKNWREGNWSVAVLLCAAPFTRFGGVLLVVAWLFLRRGWARRLAAALLGALVLGAAFAGDRGVAGGWTELALWMVLPAAWVLPGILGRPLPSRIRDPLCAIAAGGAVAAGLVLDFPGAWARQWRSHLSVEIPVLTTLDGIGRAAREATPVDALILTPIGDEIYRFKIHARRSTVVDFKHNAFSEASMVEWRRRLDRIAGRRIQTGEELDEAWQRRTPPELVQLADEFGANYILTLDAWHPLVPGSPIARCGDWVLWKIPEPRSGQPKSH